jgi:membrane-associated phospholipid phosphatase
MMRGLGHDVSNLPSREHLLCSGANSFPSGHAADTMAFATALERHFGWRYAVPAYVFASYVAMSRLHDNVHDLSDVTAGAAVGIIAERSRATDATTSRSP